MGFGDHSDSKFSGRSRGPQSGGHGAKKKRAKKKMVFRKKRPPITLKFDYKDLSAMFPFLTEEGKIVPARVSGLRSFQQRGLTVAVKRARHLGYLSAVAKEALR